MSGSGEEKGGGQKKAEPNIHEKGSAAYYRALPADKIWPLIATRAQQLILSVQALAGEQDSGPTTKLASEMFSGMMVAYSRTVYCCHTCAEHPKVEEETAALLDLAQRRKAEAALGKEALDKAFQALWRDAAANRIPGDPETVQAALSYVLGYLRAALKEVSPVSS